MLTRTDRRAEIGLDDVERTVGLEVSHTIPSDYRLALHAMNKGRPIVLEAANELATAFKTFARELAGRCRDEGNNRNRAPAACSAGWQRKKPDQQWGIYECRH